MREISVREIADSTKISTRFLDAIESGDFSSLPAPVFTRGFIREYASYLGLDPEDIVERYMAIVAEQERKREDEEAEMRDRISGRFPLPAGSSALRWVALAVLALVILAIAIYLVSSMDESSSSVPAEQESSVEAAAVPEATPEEPEEAVAARSIEMTLVGDSDSWVMLQVDEQAPLEFTLPAGGTRQFEAGERVRFLTVGNAGGVRVTLNGVEMEPLGRPNQVVKNVEFTLAEVNDLLRREAGAGPGRNE